MNIIGFSKKNHTTSYALVELPPSKRTIIYKNDIYVGNLIHEITKYYHGQFPWMYFLIDIHELNDDCCDYRQYQTIVLLANQQLQVNDETITGHIEQLRCHNMTEIRDSTILTRFHLQTTSRLCMGILPDQNSIYNVCENVIESFFVKPFGGDKLYFNELSADEWNQGEHIHINPTPCHFQFSYTSKNYNLNHELKNKSLANK